jgi:hypothetical protein
MKPSAVSNFATETLPPTTRQSVTQREGKTRSRAENDQVGATSYILYVTGSSVRDAISSMLKMETECPSETLAPKYTASHSTKPQASHSPPSDTQISQQVLSRCMHTF